MCEHICFPHITKGIILLLITGCYYALLIFGKDACFRKINLDSLFFKQQYLLSRLIKNNWIWILSPQSSWQLPMEKLRSASMEWNFQERRSSAENGLLRPGTFTSCSTCNSDIVWRHSSNRAGTQINDASLSVPESYSECRDIFHRSSLAACNSAAVTEGLLCAKCRGRSWRYQSVSHSILAHKELPAS